MKIDHISYTGPAIDDPDIVARLPKGLADLLAQTNGYIQFHGGLHVRGACLVPSWHSLREAWLGANAFHRLYPEVEPDDIPFAEDYLGDQFLIRAGDVWRLYAETGEVEPLEETYQVFMENVLDDPGEELGLHALLQFQREGGKLLPGQLLAADPPYCTEEAAEGVTLKAVSSDERKRFLADFAAKMREMSEDE